MSGKCTRGAAKRKHRNTMQFISLGTISAHSRAVFASAGDISLPSCATTNTPSRSVICTRSASSETQRNLFHRKQFPHIRRRYLHLLAIFCNRPARHPITQAVLQSVHSPKRKHRNTTQFISPETIFAHSRAVFASAGDIL